MKGIIVIALLAIAGQVASSFRHQHRYQPQPSKEWRMIDPAVLVSSAGGPPPRRGGRGGGANVLAASTSPSMPRRPDENAPDVVDFPSDDDELLLSLDASALSSLISSGRLTSVGLMEATLRRIDRVNPSANAIVSLRPREDLLAEARARDAEDLPGDGGRPPRGWLHGIPIAIKDTFRAEGLPTTMGGSPLFAASSASSCSDPHVRRLSDAGAIIIGKTNAPEFALGSNTYNPTFGRTPNPYDPTRTVGGSSGGAAAALSLRMLCLADGSDMMGSLRNPAGWANVYSHRPTAGMLSIGDDDDDDDGGGDAGDVDVDGRGDPKPPLLPYHISTAGPMARCPLDCAMMLETMAGGPDVFDASAVAKLETYSDFREKPYRIGWLADWGGSYPMEDGILNLCRGALERGFIATNDDDAVAVKVVDVPSPPFSAEKLWKSWTTIRSKIISSDLIDLVGGVDILRREAERGNVKPEVMWEVERGLRLEADEVDEAVRIAAEWSLRCESLFADRGKGGGGYDALALPTAQVWPFPGEWDWPRSVGGRRCDTYHRWMEVVVPCSLGGLPCVTIPAGFGDGDGDGDGDGYGYGYGYGYGNGDGGVNNGDGSPDGDGRGGLPMGVQLFGPRWSDSRLLSLAQVYHERTDWPSRRPPPLVNT